MASNITESDVYETNVVGPDDGDTVDGLSVRNGLQDLANRTTNINNRKNGARYAVSGTGLSSSTLATLTEEEDSNGLHALAANRVQVSRAGWYLLTLQARVVSNNDSSTNPLHIQVCVNLSGQGTVSCGEFVRFNTTLTTSGIVNAAALVNISTPASDTIGVLVFPTVGNMDVTSGNLSIVQVI